MLTTKCNSTIIDWWWPLSRIQGHKYAEFANQGFDMIIVLNVEYEYIYVHFFVKLAL